MSHIEFLEKISEGLFIEGVNYRRPKSKHMKFDSYTTEQLAELVETSKHRCQRPRMEAPRQNMHHDFLCAEHDDIGEHHIRSVPKWAIVRGRAHCTRGYCPDAASKASSSSHRHKQAPRAKAGSGVWCVRCQRAFHPACYTIFHRGAQTFDELAVMTPPCTKTPAKTAGRSRGTKRRLVDSDSKDDAPES
mmetsp:Transcript_6641/g.20704  ORF Transcript_6641/g.20704 Transcript_6641/m.20704 type:complete len:190 (+) Transcript_6641:296-865(+)|eukprot:scaffold195916_cov34-Tisochrysis_lutea.AAC.3